MEAGSGRGPEADLECGAEVGLEHGVWRSRDSGSYTSESDNPDGLGAVVGQL